MNVKLESIVSDITELVDFIQQDLPNIQPRKSGSFAKLVTELDLIKQVVISYTNKARDQIETQSYKNIIAGRGVYCNQCRTTVGLSFSEYHSHESNCPFCGKKVTKGDM